MSDVELLIVQGGKIIYDYVKEGVKVPKDNIPPLSFYMDAYLEIKDLTHDGIPEALFHSGFEGASSWVTLEHILLYDKAKSSFADVAPESFYNSGRHGLRWLGLAGRTFAVVANENWPPTVPLESRCHYCPSPFRYDVYQWSGRKAAFEIYRHLIGKKPYSEASQALDGDWALIQAGTNH